MKNSLLIRGFVGGVLAIALMTQIMPVHRGESAEEVSTKSSAVEHGEYLVLHVAQCVQCHTPRDRNGKLLQDRLLQGAVMPVNGPAGRPPWALETPWIAGLRNYEESFVLTLLQRGHRPDGSRPQSPMPAFEMTAADAHAVVSYLKSLHP